VSPAVISLRAARAARSAAKLIDSRAARELAEQLEATKPNLERLALAIRALDCDARTARDWLEQLGYLELDRCAACGQPASPRELLAWDRTRSRIYHRRCVP
jgi:hypothetical protein